MLRITELRLPLDHAEAALRAAMLARLGVADAELARVHGLPARLGRAQEVGAIVLSYTVDCELAVDEAAVLARFAGRPATCARRPTRATASSATRRPTSARERAAAAGGGRLRALRPLRRPDAGADGAARRSCWSAARRCASAPRTPGACGARACSTPNRTCSSARAAPAPSRDGKLWSQISDPRHLTRKVLTEFVKAGAPEEILYVAKPHIGTFRLVEHGREDARRDRGAGRRDPLPPAGDRSADRAGAGEGAATARPDAGRRRADRAPTTWCWRWATARATPSRCCSGAASRWRPSRSRSAFASSTRRA